MAQHILHTLDKLCKDKKISEDALVDIVKSIADCQRNEVKQYEVFIRSKDDSELK